MEQKTNIDQNALVAALAAIGKSAAAREKMTEALHAIEQIVKGDDKNARETVSGPLMDAIYKNAAGLRKKIENGLEFEFNYNSKIAREFLLSEDAVPNHVWEPQTTRILQHFSKNAKAVIVGGAFFGDQAIIITNELKNNNGVCHAFEPNIRQFGLLQANARINHLDNIIVNQVALWDKSGEKLVFNDVGDDEGNWGATDPSALGSSKDHSIDTVAINNYCKEHHISTVDLIMLDLEGGEIAALRGASELLAQDASTAPVVVFEVHSKYTDWENGFENIDVIQLLHQHNYKVFAIRDYHSNRNLRNRKIELIPSDAIYLQGPPHGFNMIAVKNESLLDDNFVFVKNVSPKYLDHRDPSIHQPL